MLGYRVVQFLGDALDLPALRERISEDELCVVYIPFGGAPPGHGWTRVQRSNLFKLCTRRFSRAFPREIVLHPPSGVVTPPIDDGRFHIHFWSVPIDSGRQEGVAQLGFWRPPQPMDGFQATGEFATFIDERDTALAELYPHNLYLLFDLDPNESDVVRTLIPLLSEVSKLVRDGGVRHPSRVVEQAVDARP
jgi:hypothetical protein